MEVNGHLTAPGGKNTRRPLNRAAVGPQEQSVWPLGEKKYLSPPSTIERRSFGLQSVAESLSTDIWRLESTVIKKKSIACEKPFCAVSVVCFSDFLRFVLFVFCSTVLQRCLPQPLLLHSTRT